MTTPSPTDFVDRVRRLAMGRARRIVPSVGGIRNVMPLLSGKMLRTRLAAHLARDMQPGPDRAAVEVACAATELVHTASLCHDDFIDGGLVRRARPTLWRSAGPACAILIGDFLIFEAIHLVLDADDCRCAKSLASKLREMCVAEAEQELDLRGRPLDVPTCLRIARGKTGPLFGFVAEMCGGDDAALRKVLEEVGYLVGTAYQLADDLLDVVGDERAAGKTLRLDSAQLKCTLPQLSRNAPGITHDHIRKLLDSALEHLEGWPTARDALAEFLCRDLLPLFEEQIGFDGLQSGAGGAEREPAGVPAGVANAAEGRP